MVDRTSPDAQFPMLAGRYVLRSELGRGGCAVVYEAFDVRLARLVALKVVRADARDQHASARLAREARTAAAIQHPNVCGVSDGGTLDDGRPFLVMERLHGETLTQCLRRVRRLSPKDATDLGLQLLSALGAAHAAGVVHRDVKPDNVYLVTRPGRGPLVKLLDFGMCRRVTTSVRDDATLTRAGQVVGTPEYMSPEQVSGQRAFSAQIDLYAVGVILYEVLAGHRAFPGKDAREVVVSVLAKKLPPVRERRRDVPASLDHAIARAMERDPGARYANAAEFQRDLLAIAAELERPRAAPAPVTGRRPTARAAREDAADATTLHYARRTA